MMLKERSESKSDLRIYRALSAKREAAGTDVLDTVVRNGCLKKAHTGSTTCFLYCMVFKMGGSYSPSTVEGETTLIIGVQAERCFS